VQALSIEQPDLMASVKQRPADREKPEGDLVPDAKVRCEGLVRRIDE
jgi:hypothetical protein